MTHKHRKIIDKLTGMIVSAVSLTGLLILVLVFAFIMKNGSHLLSFGLITGNYHPETYDVYYEGELDPDGYQGPDGVDGFYSAKWGIALKDDLDFEGKQQVLITYVAGDSPLARIPDKNTDDKLRTVANGQTLEKVIFTNNRIALSKNGAEAAILAFEDADGIADMMLTTAGTGIRGSIITTAYLILMTLLIALPIGVLTAIYLHEFAPANNRCINLIKRLIEMLTGVPSIVFGLLGAAVFIPFTVSVTKADSGNLISGALTLAVIVLPVIIASTEEALKVIPDDYREASLSLGASKTQTTFKVVFKAAIPGILSATLLSVGRIIGESAALIYAIGTAIKDNVIVTEKSASLAVLIWSVMAGEVPNFELASAVSIIIMSVVLVLNVSIKLIARKLAFNRQGSD